MSIRSLRLLVPIVVVIVAACAAPATSPTAKPQAPTAAATQAAAPTAAPAVAKPTPKPAPVSINYGFPVISSAFWHLYVGEDKGFYAEEAIDFKRTFVSTGSPSIAQGVVAGAYQLASVGADVAVAAIENGADLVYVGSEMHLPVYGVVAQPEIKSFADIKNNKRVGVASIRGGTSTVLRALFTMQGLKEGVDYTMVQAGSTGERVGALKNKSIDVGLLGQPQDFMMLEEGFANLGLTSDFVKDYVIGMTVKRDWAKANEEAVIRFLRAHARVTDWLYDPKNKEEAIQILVKATKVDEKYSRKTYELLVERLKAFVPKGEPSERAIDATVKMMKDAGEEQGSSVTGAKAVDKSYWQKAWDSLKKR